MKFSGIKIYIILLLGIYFVSIIRVFIPLMQYQLNHDYIAKNLCINIDKPALNCEGQCFVKKEMQKIAKEDSEQTEKINFTKAEEVPIHIYSFIGHFFLSTHSISENPYLNNYSFNYKRISIPPPKA